MLAFFRAFCSSMVALLHLDSSVRALSFQYITVLGDKLHMCLWQSMNDLLRSSSHFYLYSAPPGQPCPVHYMHNYLEIRPPSIDNLFVHPNVPSRFQYVSVMLACLAALGQSSTDFWMPVFHISAGPAALELSFLAERSCTIGWHQSSEYKPYVHPPSS